MVSVANSLEPIVLIGPGGIGKTTTALTVLHHERVKERFGDNRFFIPCNEISASQSNFLRRLSKALGTGVEDPEDMDPLQQYISTSQKMLIVLDNAESVLDPRRNEAWEIYAMVEELGRLSNICLCVTSQIYVRPAGCIQMGVSKLTMEAAREIFFHIYDGNERPGIIDDILRRLDFHALSITLLATAASNNMWEYKKLAREWDENHRRMLRTGHNDPLAVTIELLLTSPAFCKLGPNARDLLGVVAFFPQGIDEKNLDFLFPTILDRENTSNKFCDLSLTRRSNGFVTILAPLQRYLSPHDPKSSPLLCAARDRYFTRLSVDLDPDKPGFGDSRWIVTEDANVEHMLDVFTSINTGGSDVWDACSHFLDHLYWQKPRQTVLGSKIEGLSDTHPSKARCMLGLSRLLVTIGNKAEGQRFLVLTLMLEREWRDDSLVATALQSLPRVKAGLRREGIQQAREAVGICERLGNTLGRANCLDYLARLLLDDNQLDAAEDAALRKVELLPEKGQEFQLCQSHRLLGKICHFRGENERAIHHFTMALLIASPLNWRDQLLCIHYELAKLFYKEDKLDGATAHIEQTKSYPAKDAYNLGLGMETQALIWYRQRRLRDARCEAWCAFEIYKRLGVAKDAVRCRELFQAIRQGAESRPISSEPDSDGEFLATFPSLLTPSRLNVSGAPTKTSLGSDQGFGRISRSLTRNSLPSVFQRHPRRKG